MVFCPHENGKRAMFKDKIWKWCQNEYCGQDFWEMVTYSDIAYTLYALKNYLDAWEQKWRFHQDSSSTCQEDKDKWFRYKVMSAKELEDKGHEEYKKQYSVKKGLFMDGVKKEPMQDIASKGGRKFYLKTEMKL